MSQQSPQSEYVIGPDGIVMTRQELEEVQALPEPPQEGPTDTRFANALSNDIDRCRGHIRAMEIEIRDLDQWKIIDARNRDWYEEDQKIREKKLADLRHKLEFLQSAYKRVTGTTARRTA